MRKNIKKLIIFALVTSILFSFASPVWAEVQQNSAGAMIADAVLGRPLGISSIVVGGAFFVLSLPFSALGGNTSQAYKEMVSKPFSFSFKRPLGQF